MNSPSRRRRLVPDTRAAHFPYGGPRMRLTRNSYQRDLAGNDRAEQFVIDTAIDMGYLLIGRSERVYRCHGDIGTQTEVRAVPLNEDRLVHTLIKRGWFRIGDRRPCTDGRDTGRGYAVLVPTDTRRRSPLWRAEHPEQSAQPR